MTFDFTGIQEETEVKTLPTTTIKPCGMAHPSRRYAIQVALTFRRGRPSGANLITSTDKESRMERESGLRLEVTRICPITEFEKDGFDTCWRTALGPKHIDTDHRPDRRVSYVLQKAAFAGLANQLGWKANYTAISNAVKELRQLVVLEKTTQFGLLMVVDINTPKIVVSKDPRWDDFEEANISAVTYCEVVRLERGIHETPIETGALSGEDADLASLAE